MRSAIVLISHDRRFLENLSQATVWLDRGTTRRLDKGFAAFEAWRDAILEEEEVERHKLDRRVVQEEHWLRYGVSARRKRNQRRLAIAAGASRPSASAAQHGRAQGDVKLTVQEAKEAGKKVIEAKHIAKSYGAATLVQDFNVKIDRGDRVGIVGPNGAGKTTLINLLTGVLAPDTGSVRLGTNLEIATLDQRRESLDPEATVAATLTDGRGDAVIIDGESRHVIGYMKDFLFRPEQARTPVKALSGGERGRLMIARALARPVQPPRPRRAHQRPRPRDARPPPGDARRLSGDAPSRQPRPRLPRPHGHLDDRLRRRWADGSNMPAAIPTWWRSAATACARCRKASRRSGPGAAGAGSAKRPRLRKRLSFADQHALKTSPARIETLTEEIRRLEHLLADPDFYARDRAGFAAAGAELANAQRELAAAEEEWLRLELLREEIQRPGGLEPMSS